MEDKLMEILEYVATIVAGCAGLATFTPTAKDDCWLAKLVGWVGIGPKYVKPVVAIYNGLVSLINFFGLNFGKAKNEKKE